MKTKAIIFLAVIFTISLPVSNAQRNTENLELSDIYKMYKFHPAGIDNLRSMDDGEHYTILSENRRIDKYKYQTGEFISTILDISKLENAPILNIQSYSFDPAEEKILLMTNREGIYRHSFVADYFIYNIPQETIKPISENGKQQLATFSPDGSKIAFVRKNNLFWVDLNTGEEHQLTTDGEENKIINGAPDWVYEEEFGFSKAFVWSVDSKKIAYYRFDESHVKQFNMTMYNDLYPEWYRFKYPKAGERNSLVEIFIANLETGDRKKMNIGNETDQYIPRIKWTTHPEILSIIRLNRLQNHVWVLHADASSGESEVVYEEKEDKYVSEVSDEMITYLDNGEEFILISERDDWYSIYLYNFKTREISQITESGYDVHTLLGIDQESGIIYYSSHERGPKYLDTYSIRKDGKKKKRLTDQKGWNSTDFSKGFKYYINSYSNINTPSVISLYKENNRLIRVLEANSALKQRMDNYGFADIEFFDFTTDYDVRLEGYMIKPDDFDPDKEYPLFMFVYGGPESQNVRDRFMTSRGAWFQYLVQQGYVVACVDNRGTNARGEEFRKATYLELGKLETIDQIEAAMYLGDLPYINKDRIGIFGWSYGGYMSLLSLFKAADIFKMAIAVAPVTNWRYYDTIYTERFMRTPQENPEGYDENSPIFFVDRMKGKLLLIHGMA
ncbi:MAG: S9 family peptidase, partial [bacterium]